MKKLIALLCLVALCLPLAACSTELSVTETAAEGATTESTAKTEEIKETGPITYPEGFSVGYSRADVSSVPMPMFEDTATTIHDPIQLTCTAFCDGKNVALVMSLDMISINRSCTLRSMQIIEKEFGIPAENVMINATHTHSTSAAGGTNDMMTRWAAIYYSKLKQVVEEALRDLDVVENTYTGIGHTDRITFVRRYLMPDGTYKTHGSAEALGHETDADNEMRTLRFDRKSKKDVLMINYQTHYGSATGLYPGQLSADFIHPYRERAEKELDCHFAYQNGAGGNLNFASPIPGERKYPTFVEAIDGFMETTREALSKEETIQTGKIRSAATEYTAKVIQNTEEEIENAKKVSAAPDGEKAALCNQFGFASKREAAAILRRAEAGETLNVPLSCITFGEVAFAAYSYEMFDTSGQQVRAASPFKTTFICSLTNGSYGYLPTELAFPHGGYEVYVTRFVQGTAEELVAASLVLLNECKSAA